ncbi:PREDICTED: coiled-coil domain-containing protein 18 isoform X1 [Prunus mume]|uniref:Coiled-coil domain-containing protein 18 isoform X1 n=1 Tax=Prunus mume TaxID=102107 RepID=A0ABM1LHD1_PRUMU|nr:PREDICTED: coiled-coil domain-containing protein 18 isoform X1 [Prunus mume]
MSWIRNAVNLAVEAGATNSLTRTVRNYADSVVLHAGNAVAGGARLLLPERIGPRNLQSFRLTVKRLEEVSVSCRGVERVQLLRRWLVALKEIERLPSLYNVNNERSPDDQLNFDESMESPKRPTLVYYIDSDMGDEPKTFRDVFLHSQALEGITLSMILEEPNEEEVSLLLEIYGLCLTGGKEVHNVVMSSVQNLAAALSYYQDEVLIKREELLQFAQGAIAGLKINADLARIDAEACSIREELDKVMAHQKPRSEGCENSSEKERDATIENLKEALVEIQLCSRLEDLLLKKKSLSNGDSPEMHCEKVEKLKVFSESLANSTSQAEKRILDHSRFQKEEALNFRVAKANEVSQLEKELVAEIGQLERQREELQQELKKVIISLKAVRARLHNAREEREQFDEASNQILVHIKSKEDELSRSIASCKTEVDVVNTWISFLEDTWVLQTSYTEKKEKQVNGELERYGDHFVHLVIQLLSTYKESLGSSIVRIKNLVESLRSSQGANISPRMDDGSSKVNNPRKTLEEEYLDMEAKFLTTLSVVETMKRQFYVQTEGIFRRDDQKVKDLFDALKKIKDEFESIDRPTLEIEASPQRPETPSSDRPQIIPSPTSTSPLTSSPLTTSPLTAGPPELKLDEVSNSSLIKGEKTLDPKEELAKLEPEHGKTPPLTTGTPELKQDEVSNSSLIKGEKKTVDSKEELAKVEPEHGKAPPLTTGTPELKQDKVSNSSLIKGDKTLSPKEELAKLEPEHGKVGKEGSTEEINDWEFDELEKDLKTPS